MQYCSDLRAAGLSDEIGCFYSDGSEFVDGPPVETECPPAPDERTPFCGGGCDPAGCPPHMEDDPEIQVSCVGVNEERALGICTYDSNLGCGDDGFPFGQSCELRYGRRCACLRLRRAEDGELDSRGFATFEASCLAYRERYPGAVECMDESWTPLP